MTWRNSGRSGSRMSTYLIRPDGKQLACRARRGTRGERGAVSHERTWNGRTATGSKRRRSLFQQGRVRHLGDLCLQLGVPHETLKTWAKRYRHQCGLYALIGELPRSGIPHRLTKGQAKRIALALRAEFGKAADREVFPRARIRARRNCRADAEATSQEGNDGRTWKAQALDREA